jgi:hypothetical protein
MFLALTALLFVQTVKPTEADFPPVYKVAVLKAGPVIDIDNRLASLVVADRNVAVRVEGCPLDWAEGEELYWFRRYSGNAGRFIVPRRIMDPALQRWNFTDAMENVISQGRLCLVTASKPIAK